MGNAAEFLAEFNSQYKAQNDVYRNLAKRFGISESVFWILYFLSFNGGTMPQKDICTAMYLPKQTTNSALKKLESAGVISMSRSKSRCKDVSLTPEGKEIAERTVDRALAAELRTMEELTEEEQREFLRIFNKYNNKLSKRFGEIK